MSNLFAENKELVMVVPRQIIFQKGCWQGLWTNCSTNLLSTIQTSYQFLPRSQVEFEPSWQQIIPYQVFTYNNKYYVFQKLNGSSEKRLHYKYMLGVGGHINPEDELSENILEAGIKREWEEEICFEGKLKQNFLGFLKDNHSDVSKVHLALVYLLEGEHDNISTCEPSKMSGKMCSLSEIENLYADMDSWGQIVFKYLTGKLDILQWL